MGAQETMFSVAPTALEIMIAMPPWVPLVPTALAHPRLPATADHAAGLSVLKACKRCHHFWRHVYFAWFRSLPQAAERRDGE